MMGMMCSKCMKVSGVVFLLLGIAYLAADIGWWDFWNINWWSALFLFWGIGMLGSLNCKECMTMRGMMKKR